MAKAKIKKEHEATVVAFGNGGAPLGERNDIDQLAIIALESGNENLLNLFEEPLPSLADLKKQKVDAQLAKAPAVAETSQPKDK